MLGQLSDDALDLINVVTGTLRQDRLVPGWVTVFRRVNHLVTEQAPRSTQLSHPSVGR